LEGFCEVALVVLCLDDADLERSDWGDAEEVEAESPADDDLHHQGGFPDACAAGHDHGGSTGEPAVADEVVWIVGWVEVDEVSD